MEELLKEIYYDPVSGYIGAKKLYEKAKIRDPTIKLKQVQEWLKEQPVYQIHKEDPSKKNYLPIFSNTSKSFQIDLSFIPKYKKVNKGYWIMLTAININTRLGYAYKMKSKTEIYETILEFIRDAKPKTITSDQGSEFINKRVQDLFKDNNIEYHKVQAGDKHITGKVERFNRTIKERLNKYMTHRESPMWFDVLDDVIENYNNTVHSSIGQTPNSVSPEDEERIIKEEMLKTRAIINSRDKIKEGDTVRVPLKKKIFDKGEPRYSTTTHTVTEINSTGNAVKVSGKSNTYKYEELQKVKSDIPHIDQVDNSYSKKVEKEHKVDRKLKQVGIDENNVRVGNRVRKVPNRLDL